MKNDNKPAQKKLKVLYQFLNGQWYAFAEGNDEVYFGRVPMKSSAPKENSGQNKTQKASDKATKGSGPKGA